MSSVERRYFLSGKIERPSQETPDTCIKDATIFVMKFNRDKCRLGLRTVPATDSGDVSSRNP